MLLINKYEMHSVTLGLGKFDLQSYIGMSVEQICSRRLGTSRSQRRKDFINQHLVFDSISHGTGVTEKRRRSRGTTGQLRASGAEP